MRRPINLGIPPRRDPRRVPRLTVLPSNSAARGALEYRRTVTAARDAMLEHGGRKGWWKAVRFRDLTLNQPIRVNQHT